MAASRSAALPYRSALRCLLIMPTRRLPCCARPTKPCTAPRTPDATGSWSATPALLREARRPLSPVAHRRVELSERGERTVAGEHRRLGVVRGRHALETKIDRAGHAADRDEVRVELQRRVCHHFQARAVETDAGE